MIKLGDELNSLQENNNRDFSVIDIKDCAELLRSQYKFDSIDDLIILKYENNKPVSNGNQKSVQYEIYLPNNDTKLDLSVCKNTNFILYIPIELDEKTQKLYDSMKAQGYNLFDKNEKTQKLYDSMKAQGYNLFDKNDKFYHDICAPYK